uniref:G-protein coupled receptors family 1 profile domain-containing protein n=1 Tax=Biomphalaria glabrata TaxID=6526 RepID=A0A2C9LVX9_BIOGL
MESNSPGSNVTVLSDESSRTPRLVFLVILFITAFLWSLLIIIAFMQNLKLRTVQNILIANVCALCIADCVVNMSVVFGALVKDGWIYGDLMCKINNFFMQLVTVEVLLLLTMMTVHRYFTLWLPIRYEAWMSSRRVYALIVYLWLHCLSFTLPLLTEAAEAKFRSRLHLCTLASRSSTGFIYSMLSFCYLAPIVVCIVFHVMNLKLSRQLTSSVVSETAKESYSRIIKDNPSSPQVERSSNYSVYVSITWLVLEMPFVITSYIKCYVDTSDVTEHTYPWQMDATFIWMRFSFSSVFPFVTLLCCKELWQNVKEWVLCRKNNAIFSSDDTSTIYVQNDISHHSLDKVSSPKYYNGSDKDKSPNPFNVPVLFATSTGIYIADSNYSTEKDSQCLTSTSDMLEMKGKTLEIIYSDYEYTNELFDDTSDYDSSCEIDPYSTSQPVSTKKHQEQFQRTRSLSEPEVNVRMSMDRKQRTCLSGTSGADSGLDLSQAAGSSSATSKSSRYSCEMFAERPRACDSSQERSQHDDGESTHKS